MTDITELAQSLENAASKALIEEGLTWFCEEQLSHEDGIALHKADAEFIALANPTNILALVEALEKAQTINAAAEKLVRCKGRYHSEQNYRALAALFGVKTPDLPPLDSESSAVTVKLTDINEYLAEVHDKTLNRAFRLLAEGVRAGDVAAMRAAGIKVEAE
ncbi:ead/Ea22-like family protein [Klebsiella quasipneumoniae]|uniref:ead/Ea22-like family protein n=1 Tax=Klebsiella quasipneumoniae TaxID=1463165 RepID=UPI003F8D834D